MSFARRPSGPNDCSTWPLSWRSITMLISREPKPWRLLPLGCGAAAFLPIEHQREPLLGTRNRPRDIDVAGRLGKAAVLARVGRELVHRHAQTEGRIRLEEDVRPLERDSIEERREQHVEQLVERGRFPAALGNQAMRIGERQHAGLIFHDQIGNVARVLGGLREQGQQLGEQISRTVAQLADHQLMALVQLPALDRPRHHVRDRGQERDVIVVVLAPFVRVRAEHAIGAAVAAGDRRGDAADDSVVVQQVAFENRVSVARSSRTTGRPEASV